MSGIVKSQPVSGVQNLLLGTYHRREREPSGDSKGNGNEDSFENPLDLDSSLTAEVNEREGSSFDPDVVYQQGFEAGAVHAKSELETRLKQSEESLTKEREVLAQQLKAVSQLASQLERSSSELVSKAESIAVSIATRAVRELIAYGLINASSIQKLVTEIIEKNVHASPVTLHCGRGIYTLLADLSLKEPPVIDDRLAEYALELRTSMSFFSIDVEQYVREIFSALNEWRSSNA